MTNPARLVGTRGHYHLYPHRFHIGPFEYELVFVDGQVVCDQTMLLSSLNPIQQQIVVSTRLTQDQMTHAVIAQLCNAWNYHFPTLTKDHEAAHDCVATIVLQLLKDLGMKPIAPGCPA